MMSELVLGLRPLGRLLVLMVVGASWALGACGASSSVVGCSIVPGSVGGTVDLVDDGDLAALVAPDADGGEYRLLQFSVASLEPGSVLLVSVALPLGGMARLAVSSDMDVDAITWGVPDGESLETGTCRVSGHRYAWAVGAADTLRYRDSVVDLPDLSHVAGAEFSIIRP